MVHIRILGQGTGRRIRPVKVNRQSVYDVVNVLIESSKGVLTGEDLQK